MSSVDASLVADQRALAWLERLLDATLPEREALLAEAHTTDPALRLRLERLLAASEAHTRAVGVAGTAGSDGRSPGVIDVMARGLNALDGPDALATLAYQGPRPAATAALSPGASIAGYRLLRVLGQGGMAAVWLAERADGQLKRQVAIKLPLAAQSTGVLAERFKRERDVLAALDHPHIARLIDAGVSEAGQPFIVLEHVDGVPITEYAAERSQREKLQLFLQVLAAIEHAHRHMTVHRDLKPSNILVDTEGRVKLLDFGIAKLLEPGPDAMALTQDASVLTPAYAAPEQVSGGAVTTATDVYGAGVVLYELLTGQRPYGQPQDSPTRTMLDVLHTEARPPRLALDLDTVLLKALRKAPADRYASIERFAEDLRRWLAHEPILARRVPLWQRARLAWQRHRLAGGAIAFGALLLAVAAGVAWQQQREASAQKARADAVREFMVTMVGDVDPAEGKSEVTGLDIIDAAVARAEREFANDPILHGELLSELGRVYFRLQRPAKAVTTLEHGLRLLDAQARPSDAALNYARVTLAQVLMTSDRARAETLAQQARADCTSPGTRCAYTRSLAHYVLSTVVSATGDWPAALEHARQMLREAELAHGAGHLHTAEALMTVAQAARNFGEPREAAAALKRAQEVSAGRTLKSWSRQWLDFMQAVIDIDLGLFASAQGQLQALLALPANDSDRNLQWRQLYSAETGLGRLDAALAAAEQAQRLAPANMNGALSLMNWAEAASRKGMHEAAGQALARALADAEKTGVGTASGALRRMQRAAGEALLRRGAAGPAAMALAELVQAHQKLPHPNRGEWALALNALACAQHAAGSPETAATLAQAAEQHAAAFEPEHPLRLRHEALRGMVGAGSPDALGRWLATLAADSPWRQQRPADCSALM